MGMRSRRSSRARACGGVGGSALQTVELGLECLHLRLQFQDPTHSGQADAGVREFLDPAEQGDVALRIAAAPALRARRAR